MADKKISALTSASALSSTDVFPFVQRMETTPVTRKVTLTNLFNLLPSSGCIVFGTDTNLYRSAANQLKTDDTLLVSGSLVVSSSMVAANFTPSGTYTPTWSGSSSNPSIGNGTLLGRYGLFGKHCHLTINITAGSTTTFGGGSYSLSLPFTSASVTGANWIGVAHIRDSGTANYERHVLISQNSSSFGTFIGLVDGTNVNTWTAASPFTFGNGDTCVVDILYEVA